MNMAAHPRSLLRAYNGPGLFITATGTDVGKTTVAAALAGAFRRLHIRVGVCKAVASGCPKRPDRGNAPQHQLTDDDFFSPDAAALARACDIDPTDESLLPYLSPLRFAAPVSPALAAMTEGRNPDWRRLAAALDFWQENCDLLLVEGAGGWYVPVNPAPHDYMIADMAAALRLPVLVVTTAELGAINQTLLTVHAIQEKKLPVVGMVINRVPAEGRRDQATASNIEELPRLSGVPVRAILPDHPGELDTGRGVPPEFVSALEPFARDWWGRVSAKE